MNSLSSFLRSEACLSALRGHPRYDWEEVPRYPASSQRGDHFLRPRYHTASHFLSRLCFQYTLCHKCQDLAGYLGNIKLSSLYMTTCTYQPECKESAVLVRKKYLQMCTILLGSTTLARAERVEVLKCPKCTETLKLAKSLKRRKFTKEHQQWQSGGKIAIGVRCFVRPNEHVWFGLNGLRTRIALSAPSKLPLRTKILTKETCFSLFIVQFQSNSAPALELHIQLKSLMTSFSLARSWRCQICM